MAKIKIVVVCGPTASGKSGLAIDLSKKLQAEMLGADSMQIYQGLVIGTAMVTEQEADGIPQHLTGFLSPSSQYSVADYVEDAKECIAEIAANNHNIVVVGGTGLYISSLVNGITFTEEKSLPENRALLEEQWDIRGAAFMLSKLAEVDPDYAKQLHINDKKRILRGIEQWLLTRLTMEQRIEQSLKIESPFEALCIGLDFPDRQDLYNRINLRVDEMLEEGILEEAKEVFLHRETYKTAAQAIGYKEFFPFFLQEKSLEDCILQLKKATRNYAKRQLTWFRKMPNIHWLNADDENVYEKAYLLANNFLQQNNPDKGLENE